MVNEANVRRLMHAGWTGMVAEMELHGVASGAEVVNAGVMMAKQAIEYACSPECCGANPKDIARNRQIMKDTLMAMLLSTADELKVM